MSGKKRGTAAAAPSGEQVLEVIVARDVRIDVEELERTLESALSSEDVEILRRGTLELPAAAAARVRRARIAALKAREAAEDDAEFDDVVRKALEGEPAVALRTRVPDVKALRRAMKLTQAEFADRFGLALDALRNWEQRRRTPDRMARMAIRLIAADPELAARIAREEDAAQAAANPAVP